MFLGFNGDFPTWQVTAATELQATGDTLPLQVWHHWCFVASATGATRSIYKNGKGPVASDSGAVVFSGAGAPLILGAGKRNAGNPTPGGVLNGAIGDARIWYTALAAATITSGYRRGEWPTTGLQAWWRMKEGAGSTVYDYSGKRVHLTAANGFVDWQESPGCAFQQTGGDGYLNMGSLPGGLSSVPVRAFTNIPAANSDLSFTVWASIPTPAANQWLFHFGSVAGAEAGSVMQFGFTSAGLRFAVLSSTSAPTTLSATEKYGTAQELHTWALYTLTLRSYAVHGTQTQVNMYRNDQLLVSHNMASDFTGSFQGSMMTIGCGATLTVEQTGGLGECFQGLMDEVRFYSRVLSFSEIKRAYSDNVYPTNGLQAYWPFSEQTGNIARDASGNGQHLRSLGGAALPWVSAGQVCRQAPLPLPLSASPTGAPVCAQTTRYDGHVVFNGGAVNTLSYAATDGTVNLYAGVLPSAPLLLGGDYTFSLFVQRLSTSATTTAAAQHYLFNFGPDTALTRARLGVFFSSNQLVWSLNSNDWTATHPAMVETGVWHMWTGVYSQAARARFLYLDGNLIAVDRSIEGPILVDSNSKLWVGCGRYTDDSHCIHAGIDEFRLFGRALSSDEVQAAFELDQWDATALQVHYPFNDQSGAMAIDHSGNGYNLLALNQTGFNWRQDTPLCATTQAVAVNCTSVLAPWHDGYAVSFATAPTPSSVPESLFSAPNDGTSFPVINLIGAHFTVCAWLRVGTGAGSISTVAMTVFTTGASDFFAWTIATRTVADGSTPLVALFTAASASAGSGTNNPQNIVPFEWHLHCVQKQSNVGSSTGFGSLTTWQDGQYMAMDGTAGPGELTANGPLSIGARSDATLPFVGALDNFMLWTRLLTPAEMLVGFQTHSWSTASLKLHLPFNESLANVGYNRPLTVWTDAMPSKRTFTIQSNHGLTCSERAEKPACAVAFTPTALAARASAFTRLSSPLQLSIGSLSGSCTPVSSILSDQVTTMTNPRGLALDADSRMVYVVDTAGNALYRVNMVTLERVTISVTTATLSAPRAVVYDPVYSQLYIADTGNNRLVQVSVSTAFASAAVAVSLGGYLPLTPAMLAMDSTRQVLYMSHTSNSVHVLVSVPLAFPANTSRIPTGSIVFTSVSGIAVDSSQQVLYVTDLTLLGIVRVPLLNSNSASLMAVSPAYTFTAPRFISIDVMNQLLYVADSTAYVIVPIAASQQTRALAPTGVSTALAYATAFLPASATDDAALWVLDSTANKLQQLTLPSARLQSLSIGNSFTLSPAFSPVITEYRAFVAANQTTLLSLSAVALSCGSQVAVAVAESLSVGPSSLLFSNLTVASQSIALPYSTSYLYVRVITADLLRTRYYSVAVSTAAAVAVPGAPSTFALPQSWTIPVLSSFRVVLTPPTVAPGRNLSSIRIFPLVSPFAAVTVQVLVSSGSVYPTVLTFPATSTAALSVVFTAPLTPGDVQLSLVVLSGGSQFQAPTPVVIGVTSPLFTDAAATSLYASPSLAFSMTMPDPTAPPPVLTYGKWNDGGGGTTITSNRVLYSTGVPVAGVVQTLYVYSSGTPTTVTIGSFTVPADSPDMYFTTTVPAGYNSSAVLPVPLVTGLNQIDVRSLNLYMNALDLFGITMSAGMMIRTTTPAPENAYAEDTACVGTVTSLCQIDNTGVNWNGGFTLLPVAGPVAAVGESSPWVGGVSGTTAMGPADMTWRLSVPTCSQQQVDGAVDGLIWRSLLFRCFLFCPCQ